MPETGVTASDIVQPWLVELIRVAIVIHLGHQGLGRVRSSRTPLRLTACSVPSSRNRLSRFGVMSSLYNMDATSMGHARRGLWSMNVPQVDLSLPVLPLARRLEHAWPGGMRSKDQPRPHQPLLSSFYRVKHPRRVEMNAVHTPWSVIAKAAKTAQQLPPTPSSPLFPKKLFVNNDPGFRTSS